jgi:hypothetical protein
MALSVLEKIIRYHPVYYRTTSREVTHDTGFAVVEQVKDQRPLIKNA